MHIGRKKPETMEQTGNLEISECYPHPHMRMLTKKL